MGKARHSRVSKLGLASRNNSSRFGARGVVSSGLVPWDGLEQKAREGGGWVHCGIFLSLKYHTPEDMGP